MKLTSDGILTKEGFLSRVFSIILVYVAVILLNLFILLIQWISENL